MILHILAAIIGFAEMIEEDIPLGKPKVQHAQRVINAASRGRELVQQILAFSRKTEHARHPVSLSAITMKQPNSYEPHSDNHRYNIEYNSHLRYHTYLCRGATDSYESCNKCCSINAGKRGVLRVNIEHVSIDLIRLSSKLRWFLENI